MKHRFSRFAPGLFTLVFLFGLLLIPFAATLVMAEGKGVNVAASLPVIADFEGGVPAGWFQYGDSSATVTPVVTNIGDTDSLALPGQVGYNDILSVTAIVSGTWAGFGAGLNPVQDWSDYDALSFWYYGGNLSTTHEIEIQTVSGDDRRATFVDDFTGWRQIVLPFNTFGAGGDYDVSQVDNWVFVLDGTVGSFKIDNLQLVNLTAFADFEGSVPTGWFQYGDSSATVTPVVTNIGDTDSLALPGQVGYNDILSVTAIVSGTWAGFGAGFNPVRDWSDMQGVSFWFYGENSGTTYQFEIQTVPSDDRRATFTDDFTGWQLITLPFDTFGATPYDVSQVDNWVLVLDGVTGSFKMDHLNVYGDAGNITQRVQFSNPAFTVTEGDVATVTVRLNVAADMPVTVTYAITNGTAILGEDYLGQDESGSLILSPASGKLVFAAGETEQSFTIQTVEDTEKETSPETVLLSLVDPQGAVLGARAEAVLNIEDNESLCGSRTLMIDAFDNYRTSFPFQLKDVYSNTIGFLTYSDGSPVALTTTQIISGEAMTRPGQTMTNTVVKFDSNIGGWGGFTHNFENPAGDTWLTKNWSTYEGIAFWFYGTGSGVNVAIELQENRPAGATVPGDGGVEVWNAPFKDDVAGWRFVELPWSKFTRKEIGNGAPNDGLTLEQVHGWAFLSLASGGAQTHYFDNVQVCGARTVVKNLEINFNTDEYPVTEGQTATLTVTLNMTSTQPISVHYVIQESGAAANVDYLPTAGTLTFAPGQSGQSFTVATLDDHKYEGSERVSFVLTNPTTGTIGYQARGILVINDDESYNPALLDDFENGTHQFKPTGGITITVVEIPADDPHALPGQGAFEHVVSTTFAIPTGTLSFPGVLSHPYFGSRDWSDYNSFNFWYYGQNSGNPMQVEIADNRAADPGPSGWELAWSDEFSDTAGTPPNPAYWSHEIGDGALNGNTGWGNGEFEYYTNSTDNAATDGNGNLVITLRKVNTDTQKLTCWYGDCQYTSARLLSQNKIDFAYGRIEARIKVPAGQGLWPAFWMLGNDISQVDWPTSGEIDIMEYVGKDPNGVYGTLHGPGYSGGNGYGSGLVDIGEPVADNFHTFAVEWQPGEIRWFIDETNFFTATEAALPTVKPGAGPWVYDHPFFILMNLAVGGNFPGNPDDTTPFPAEMTIDYVRVYQAPDTAERFTATFTDNFTGWKQVSIPFANFARTSSQQRAAVPNDGLTLTEMWGYSVNLPADTSGAFYMDQISLAKTSVVYLPVILK